MSDGPAVPSDDVFPDSGSVAIERHWHEECGVFGIFPHPDASHLTYLGLHALQHRGQESAGIVTTDGERLRSRLAMGLVQDVFDGNTLDELKGHGAIGHVRYSTTGSSTPDNIQPFFGNYAGGHIALAHNGNLINADQLKHELEARGALFRGTSDTEVILYLAIQSKQSSATDRIIEALGQVKGAYSLVVMTDESLIAVRDPHGFRPLVLGKVKDAYVVASETCAFRLVDADYVREVEPGEVIEITRDGLKSYFPWGKSTPTARCIFEYVYFARPDSLIYQRNVYVVRREMGRILAREAPVAADVIVPVPDSGVPAAIGFSEVSGIPYQTGLIRSHYVGRTFIEPRDSIRNFGVRLKLSPVHEVLRGQRVVVVDDSIVRGTTSRKLVHLFRKAGAVEVHMRISSPPTIGSCYYGVDTPNREELIASKQSVDEIRDYLGADSLAYLSLDGMRDAAGNHDGYCDACFTGRYPVAVGEPSVAQLPLFTSHPELPVAPP
ncbi:MAG: amidophosphoribosyltransferase [Deltaproteobacteria bacterium]|nr:amidophosphoribosyltransferase [Deltaproteobacteria bacterium]